MISGPWIEATTIGDLLLRSAERYPDKLAVAFPEDRRTYAELAEAAVRVARALRALGVGRGDHVGILMPNCIDGVECFFGISLLGAVIVPVNARYRATELAYVVENADLKVLVTSDIIEEHVDYAALLHESLTGLADAADPCHLDLPVAPRLDAIVLLGQRTAGGMLDRPVFEALADEVPEQDVDRARQQVRLRDVAIMPYTSGTTASPKGCPHTHDGMVRNITGAGERWHVGPDDTMWDPLPLFHMSAICPMLFTLQAGGTFLSMTHFEPKAAIEQMVDESATLIYPCFPPIATALFNDPGFDAADLSKVRGMLNVAPLDMLRFFQSKLPNAPQIGSYGMTEGGGVISYNDLDDDPQSRDLTQGKPLRGMEIRVIDPGTGADLPTGTPGEAVFRGVSTIDGYYKDPQRTSEMIDSDGWFHSGDLCTLDDHGNVTYRGRIKEMLKVGGENVAPAELEGFLATHPAVKMVQAVGIPDERLVEVPAVFVELIPGETASVDELIEHCRGKIASYKIPRHVRFVSADEWPMSATKVQRFRLRDRLMAELGLQD